MTEISIDPLYIEIGGPALLAGILIGALIVWLLARRRNTTLAKSVELLETKIKAQDALQVDGTPHSSRRTAA